MKYILLMQFSIGDWNANNTNTWSQENIRANLDFLEKFNRELEEAGEFVDKQGLAGPEDLRIVRADADGKRSSRTDLSLSPKNFWPGIGSST